VDEADKSILATARRKADDRSMNMCRASTSQRKNGAPCVAQTVIASLVL